MQVVKLYELINRLINVTVVPIVKSIVCVWP